MNKGKNLVRTGTIVAAALVSACTAVEGVRPDIASKPLPSRLDEIAYINTLRGALVKTSVENCFTGKDLPGFKAKLGQGYRGDPDPENFLSNDSCLLFKAVDTATDGGKKQMTEYLHAGFGLTDMYCKRFFVVASEAQQNRQFARNVNNGVDTLLGSILSLSNAGETAIGISNGMFGLIDGTLEGFDLAYLVGPDMPEVERLVKAEQAVFRAAFFGDTPQKLPPNYGAARAVIESYAGLCSFTGMRQLVAKSVADKTEALNSEARGKKPEEPKKGETPPKGEETKKDDTSSPPPPPPASDQGTGSLTQSTLPPL
jgi:hypothetical protein